MAKQDVFGEQRSSRTKDVGRADGGRCWLGGLPNESGVAPERTLKPKHETLTEAGDQAVGAARAQAGTRPNPERCCGGPRNDRQGWRLDPNTDGRKDSRPTVRETLQQGDLLNDFDFNQTPLPLLVLKPQQGVDKGPWRLIMQRLRLDGMPTAVCARPAAYARPARGRAVAAGIDIPIPSGSKP